MSKDMVVRAQALAKLSDAELRERIQDLKTRYALSVAHYGHRLTFDGKPSRLVYGSTKGQHKLHQELAELRVERDRRLSPQQRADYRKGDCYISLRFEPWKDDAAELDVTQEAT